MGFGILSSIRGASAREIELEVISNNLSNMNTPGFREMNVSFNSEMNSMRPSNNLLAKAQANIKSGKTYTNLKPGGSARTDNPTDLALQGEGFFSVQTEKGTRYTRNGSFGFNTQGQLTTAQGDLVLGEAGPIAVAPGSKFQVNQTGDVMDGEGQILDRLRIREFINPQDLKAEGSNYFVDNTEQFKENPSFTVMQGHLENSNVSMVDNITRIIQVSRAYESIQKSMKQQIEANKMLNQLPKLG